MSTALYDSIARIARYEANARGVAAVGRVVSQLAAAEGAPSPDHGVTVELRDSGLVLPRVPIAVGALGFAAMPAVDDLVVVLFLDGDVNAPVVVGRLYHPDQNPPVHDNGQLVLHLPSGDSSPKLKLEVKGDTPSIRCELPDNVTLEILKDKVQVTVGEVQLSLQSSGGGRAEVAAGGSKITLKQDGNIVVKAAGDLVLEGTNVEISGSGNVKLRGAKVEVN
ncbi:phage baseplate assembly protein V [Nodosilinea sp. E11]|uniref:phage baseplate assembly protein V n=1 Tax=Nodosilinea sp. E11 TaxID=3037479 RepID=UPI00293426EE|nr:phage baseplate assembly protein V [Nodosilinea sp. E11]WOD39719.1 phage baseplate assembly protein V [Nodosilinea sp. E11]